MQPQVFHPDPDKKRDDAPPLNASTPVSQMRPNNLGSPRKPWGKIVLTVMALIGLGVGGWYGYKWYQKNNQDKTTLNNQVKELQSKNEQLNKNVQTTPTPVTNVYKIQELGIQFEISSDLADLVYGFNQKSKVALFTTRSLSYAIEVDRNFTNTGTLSGRIGDVKVLDKEQPSNVPDAGAWKKVATLSNGKLVYFIGPISDGIDISKYPKTSDIQTKGTKALEAALAKAELIK